MEQRHLKHFRQKLLEYKSQLEEDIRSMRETGRHVSMQDTLSELSMYDNHPADIGDELFERSKDFALEGNAWILLGKVNDALCRIDKGTYGVCERCGKEIGLERLKAAPFTSYCLKCKQQGEDLDDRHPRPIEEDVLSVPFRRSFLDESTRHWVGYDGEDIWQDVAQYGTSNSPQDVPGSTSYDDLYIDSDEKIGTVTEVEGLIDEDHDSFEDNPQRKRK